MKNLEIVLLGIGSAATFMAIGATLYHIYIRRKYNLYGDGTFTVRKGVSSVSVTTMGGGGSGSGPLPNNGGGTEEYYE